MIRPYSALPLLAGTIACLVLSALMAALPGGGARAAQNDSPLAKAVWGQPDVMSVDRHCNHLTSMTLCGPAQVATDNHDNLWVADLLHSRVLLFPPGSAIASKVFGQYGSMTTHGCDQPPPTGSHYPSAPNRYTLCQPAGLAVDHNGTLYVSDSLNNRVLVYYHAAKKPADAPADRVLGQPSFHASASNDRPAGGSGLYRCSAPDPASACTLNSPMELNLTAHGDLLVPDLDNHRVLLWTAAALGHLKSRSCAHACPFPAGQVWGQYGSFSAASNNEPVIPAGVSSRCTPITPVTPVSACTLSDPWSALSDGHGNLYVADTANNRVLEYANALQTGRQDATTVYGQEGSFVTAGPNGSGVSDSSLWHPLGLAFDPAGRLWITDFYNMRVLGFPPAGSGGDTVASEVLGQEGSFSTHGCQVGSQDLCGPTGIAFGPDGRAFVADGLNNRVLAFFSSPILLVRVDHLSVLRQGSRALIRWHSTGAVRGFTLSAGVQVLTAHLLHADSQGDCSVEVNWTGLRPLTLHVVLNSGQDLPVTGF